MKGIQLCRLGRSITPIHLRLHETRCAVYYICRNSISISPPPTPDYRGHVSLECHEDCSIAYHLTCWRKYKTECEQKTDKEFLLTPCATPDCCGYVSMVVIYDTKGAVKAKVRRGGGGRGVDLPGYY